MKNITVLFEPSKYKELIYKTTTENENIKITSKAKLFESIICENKELILPGTASDLKYTFNEIGNHIVKIKFKENLTDLTSIFNGCSTLISIPENIFYEQKEILYFYNSFVRCSSLVSIPKKLFNNNKKVIDFRNCFALCSNLVNEIPSDENGIKLWERTAANGYVDNINGSGCFTDCTNLTDYSEIPSNWK